MIQEHLIGSHLEQAGWRQCSLVSTEDTQQVMSAANYQYQSNLVLVMASQSCDIANNSIETDPYVELSVGKLIGKLDGNLTYNKNPRVLHTQFSLRTNTQEILSSQPIELKAFEKLLVPKKFLIDFKPDSDRVLEQKYQKSYVAWLSARYSRPALPTAFNDLLKTTDRKNKSRKIAKKGNTELSGIYVELHPNTDINANETYRVNLLGLLPAGYSGDRNEASSVIEQYSKILEKAGMDVAYTIHSEDEVSVAFLSRFQRFYLDDLSFKDDAPLPPEINNTL